VPERYLGRALGKYRVEELIGSGGFAWVFRGFDPELEIPVAIKVLKPQFGGDPAFEERFRREASTAAKLRHPNIIKIYSVGREGDAVYFVMDYLPSGLADKLEHTATLPEEFVVRVGIDVARALGFAHREGVIHRDIKVDNIMFDVHGNAVVADFGIARAVSGYTQQTGTNMVVGTPQYFAPEQARAKPLDGRADIYSLGVTMYRAATGRLPFEGDDWYEIARQHVEEPPPALRAINASLTPEFERIVLRCLAKHPDDRPSTGEELADELAGLLEARRRGGSRTVTVSPSHTSTVISAATPRATRRIPARVLVPSALLVIALGGLTVPFLARRISTADGDTLVVRDTLPPATVIGPPPTPAESAITPVVVVDSAGKRLVRRDTTALRPSPVVARLAINAPNDAQVTLNGVSIGDGRMHIDTLKPGSYTVVASFDNAVAGCDASKVEQTVTVYAGQRREITLTPRACGYLDVDGQSVNAFFELASTSGDVKRTGRLPLASRLTLPVGRYVFTAQRPQCSAYQRDDIQIEAGATFRIAPFRLICATP
jgi:serine/threonine-protein kinase